MGLWCKLNVGWNNDREPTIQCVATGQKKRVRITSGRLRSGSGDVSEEGGSGALKYSASKELTHVGVEQRDFKRGNP